MSKSSQHFAIISYCFTWFDAVEFVRLQCPNDKRCDNVVFVVRFLCQVTMFENRVVIWLSWLHQGHNAYETDIFKITATFCWISYCFAWFDTVEFIRLPCQTDKGYHDVVFADRFRHQLAMFECHVFVRLSWLLHAHNEFE